MAKEKMQDMTQDWKLYKQGIDYNHSLSPDYYATVNRNWRAYNVQLWNGVNSKNLPKTSMPMSKRVVSHSVSSCMTKSVKMNFTVENIADNTENENEIEQKQLADYISNNSKDRWEKLKMDSLIETLLLNGANEGDYAAHTYWDADYDTGQTNGIEPILDADGNPVLDAMGMPQYRPVPILGEFCTEAVDGANIFFGNPNDTRINFNGKPKQPYIIVAGREGVSDLREEAKAHKSKTDKESGNGLTDDEINTLIVADTEYNEQTGDRGKKELENGDSEYGKATYIIKYWKKSGKIYFNKSVKGCYIRKKVDTELTIYPIAWANWDVIKNSYHGQALMTGLVENQLELDRTYARLFKYIADMAFPKAIVNKSYLPNGVKNKIGDVIEYEGSENIKPNDVIAYTQPAQIANGVIEIVSIFQSKTMELLGASDTVLGSATPENTSAIVALTQNAAVPLESVKRRLYQFIEDIGYVWLDFMLRKYKVERKLAMTDENGVRTMVPFDPSKLENAKFRIKVDVVPGGYMDEFSATRAIENLFDRQIADAVDLVERIPDSALPEKEKLLAKIKKKQQMMETMQTEEYKMQVIQEFMQQAQGAPSGQPAPQ